MDIVDTPDRFHHPKNAFGFLRLFFASLVIVSHAPEMIDGNASRELLTRATGTMTFGGLAVAGFFIISGFLISGSYLNTKSLAAYFVKRIARIYPAFAVVSILCVFVLAPLVGGEYQGFGHQILKTIIQILKLDRPSVENAFKGLHFDDPIVALNGAAWTIPLEFRCYILLVVIGVTGVIKKGWGLALLAALFIVVSAPVPEAMIRTIDQLSTSLVPWLDNHRNMLRFFGFFLAGSTFYHYQHIIPLNVKITLICVVGLIFTSLIRELNDVGISIFGTYLIFACARWGAGNWLSKVNNTTDVSYGVYLYAWPITQILIWIGFTNPVSVAVLTFAGALACGFASWKLVEQPAMAIGGIVARRATALTQAARRKH